MSSLAGQSRPFDSFGPNIIAESKAGRISKLFDIRTDPWSAPYATEYASMGTKSFVVIPLAKEGVCREILFLYSAEPRQWSAADVPISEDVAQRMWNTVERAHAERELSEDRQRLQAILDTIPTGLIMLDATAPRRSRTPNGKDLGRQREAGRHR